MKKLILLALVLFSAATMLAQTNRMSYQAVVRNAANELVAEENLTVAIRISDANSTSAFSETHNVTSNRNGVISLMIGEGSGQSGSMASVDWRTAQIHTVVTLSNGATLTNTTPVNAVPYAFYADSVDIHWVNDAMTDYLDNHSISNIVETDPTVPDWAKEANKPAYDYSEIANTPTIPSVPTNVSAFENDANYITAADIPAIPTVPTDVSAFNNDAGYITAAEVPAIPTVPTDVSAFNNDAGYITSADVPTQVNADWNATTGAAQILNKPTGVSVFDNDANYITAADIPAIPTVPTDVSAFNNDAGYITAAEVPAVTVPTDVSAFNNDAGYITNADIPAQVNADWNATTGAAQILNKPTDVSAFSNDAGYITAAEVPAVSVPTNVSAFDNDANYITAADIPAIPTVPTEVSAFNNDAGYITAAEVPIVTVPTNVSAFDNDANYITAADIPAIPSVPTEVSAFNNDAGYITAAEVPAVSVPTDVSAFNNDAGYITSADVPAQVNADWNATTGAAQILNKPTDVSAFNNDAGYITAAEVPAVSVPTDVSAFNNDAGYITAAEVPAVSVPTNVSAFNNDAGYITAAEVPAVSVPTNVSAFENDANYITNADIPAQVNSDWNATTGAAQILNKPTDVSAFNNDAGYITAAEVPAVSVPTNVSAFNNDAGYITAAEVPAVSVPTNVSAFNNDAGYITAAEVPAVSVPTNVSAFENDANYITNADIPAQENSDWNATTGAAQILNKPTDVSAFNNDAGYITAAEVPAVSVPTNVSAFNNDAGYITAAEVPAVSVPTNVSAFNNDAGYITAAEVPAVSVPTNVSAFENDANYITNADIPAQVNSDWNATTGAAQILNKPELFSGDYNDLTNTPTIPTVPANVSEFNNDAGYITAEDIPAIPTVPTDVSAFNNDAGYITGYNETQTLADVTAQGNSAGNRQLKNVSDPTDPQDAVTKTYLDQLVNNLTGLVQNLQQQLDSLQNVVDALTGGGTTVTQPTVTTSAATNITSTSATLNGSVSNPDNVAITAQGFEWKATAGGAYVAVNATGETMTYALTGLTAGTSYTYRAFVTTAEGTSYGEAVSFTTLAAGGGAVEGDAIPCPGTPTVSDHEGNVYATVQIGDQCWMRDNLRTTTSPSTGTYLIPAASTGYTYTGKQARWYNNDSATYAPMNYGLLYNWNAAVDTFNTTYGETSVNTSSSNAVSVSFSGHRRGICPVGWHLPSDAEWTQLENYVGSQSEYTCGDDSYNIAKALASTEGWNTDRNNCVVGNDPSSNNATGFSAVPAGICDGSSFYIAGDVATFWSSTQFNSSNAYYRNLNCYDANVFRPNYPKPYGFSVRCLRDETGGGTVVTTSDATDVTVTSATLNGSISNPDNVAITAQGFEWKAIAGGAYVAVNATGETMTYNLTGLTAGTSYTYRAFVTTAEGTSYGETVIFTTLAAGGGAVEGDAIPCPNTPTVTDHEGNVYATVQIGNQCWMRDNLRTTTSPSTGTYLIPSVGTGYTWSGKQARWYNNDSATYAPMNYGLLYNWNAAVDTFNTAYGETSVNTSGSNDVFVTFSGHRRGICPVGWHLPSDAEWTQLTNYVSSQSEYQCGGNSSRIAKALASTVGWNTYTYDCVVGNAPSANNATGFSAVPAGYCDGSSFDGAGFNAYFWSSTQNENGSNYAYHRYLVYDRAYVFRVSYLKNNGFSVRCLRDNDVPPTSQTQPSVTTSAATNITSTSAMLNGNVSNPGNVAITAQGFEWKATAGGAYVAVNATGETMTYNLTGLTADTSYTYRAFVTTAEGTSYGEAVSFTTLAAGGGAVEGDAIPCPDTPTVTDHEGNVYNTVQIGTQCWTKENLRTTTSPSTGTYLIPAANANNTFTGKQARWYNNDSATYAPMNYGLLYNWNAVVDTFNIAYGETSVQPNTGYYDVTFTGHRRGICPQGWHVPSDAEWTTLIDYLNSHEEYRSGGFDGFVAKALASTNGWSGSSTTYAVGNNRSSNNATGFSAVPAGYCIGSSFNTAGNDANFWSSTSSTEYYSSSAYGLYMYYDDADVGRNNDLKNNGYSVRCLRD